MDKQRLIDLVEELLKEENLESRNDDLMFLKKQYNYLSGKDEDSFYEQQLNDKFCSLYKELAQREPRLTQSAFTEKKNIIASAKNLLDRKDILKANKELDELNLEFKKAGRCPKKEQDDELFNEFKQVKDEFYAKKRAYFEELDKANAAKKEKKEDIIARAKEVCKIINIKEANEKMDALMQEWKEVGYSGKEDDALWKAFSEVRGEFQNKKKEHHQEMIKLFEERAKKKEELIKNAKILLANSEFTDEEVQKVKNLRKEFNAIGFAGKEKDDELYQSLNAIIQKYFEEMKFYKL